MPFESDLTSMQDRLYVERLIYSLGSTLDDKDFERLRTLFTASATVTTPGGTAQGHEAIVEQARQHHSTQATLQHVTTNVLIDLQADRATARANFIAIFTEDGPTDPSPRLLGQIYRFEFERTHGGWRIAWLISTPRWSLGIPATAP